MRYARIPVGSYRAPDIIRQIDINISSSKKSIKKYSFHRRWKSNPASHPCIGTN
jgi:hypothetical protein